MFTLSVKKGSFGIVTLPLSCAVTTAYGPILGILDSFGMIPVRLRVTRLSRGVLMINPFVVFLVIIFVDPILFLLFDFVPICIKVHWREHILSKHKLCWWASKSGVIRAPDCWWCQEFFKWICWVEICVVEIEALLVISEYLMYPFKYCAQLWVPAVALSLL